MATAAPAEDVTLGEVVVTARRRSESLQEVPQTVNAVSADTLGKLNITQFSDVQNVVPGLSLQNQTNGYAQNVSMRGVNFDRNTAAPLGTVAMYSNDAPVEPSFVFTTLFDIGQIEVLRGPQGTTRGVSTPSGAMTVTTRKPDLSDFGGYINGTATDQQGRNLQGALNIPVIADVLAVRVAGFIDDNQGDGTRSIHNPLRQSFKTSAERFSVSYEPSDRFAANVMYQHSDKHLRAYDAVSGPGHTGPGAFVDPPLSPFDRAAVEDGISDARVHQDLVTANVDSRIFGQHLSYVGMYAMTKTNAVNLGTTSLADVGDILPGIELYNKQFVGSEYTTHEIRLASDPAPGRFFDYTVGGFYSWAGTNQPPTGIITQPMIPTVAGTFGAPGGLPNLSAYNPTFGIGNFISQIPGAQEEYSVFGSLTLHLGENTELSAGVRHMWTRFTSATTSGLANGKVATPASFLPFGGTCGPLPSTYPGFCDTPVPAQSFGTAYFHASDTPNIYNVSLSHHFSRDLLVYANTGSSYRSAFNSPGIQSVAVLTSTDPLVQSLNTHPAEKSKSYEVGVKWTFLDGRARINADVYRQTFKNFTMITPNVQPVDAATFNFTVPVDAKVEGIELDSALQITHDWNMGLQYSYADGRVQGSLVPCNTFDAAGNPTFNHGAVSFCPGGSASRLPYWNATVTSEYTHPVSDKVDGFVRGLFSYYPKNENRMEANFTVPSYGLLNLYAGLRSQDGAWEVSLFAKNALKEDKVLDKSPVNSNLNGVLGLPTAQGGMGSFLGTFFPANSGYFSTQVTPPREVGISVRYAFGSH